MHDILKDIVRKKQTDIARLKAAHPLETLAADSNYESNFYEAIASTSKTAIIAEIKLASPTHPLLGRGADILSRVKDYEQAGAKAVSFITEKHYFKSGTHYLTQLQSATSLPILQKDFVIDEYQIYEARALGSDAILLIARLVDAETLQRFVQCAVKLGIEPVVEVDNVSNLQKALTTSARCIAVNARNLATFTVDIVAAGRLIAMVPDTRLRLGFSGIETVDDVRHYTSCGAQGVLVGTSLMKAKNITHKLRELQS